MPIRRIVKEAKRTATNNIVRNITAGTIFGNPQDNMIVNMQGGRKGSVFSTGGNQQQVQTSNNQMVATQGVPNQQIKEQSQVPAGYQDFTLADGTIQRMNMTDGSILHKRTPTPSGHQDINLENGKINRINLQTGQSEII